MAVRARGARDSPYKSRVREQFLSASQEVEQYPFLRSLPTVRLPCFHSILDQCPIKRFPNNHSSLRFLSNNVPSIVFE